MDNPIFYSLEKDKRSITLEYDGKLTPAMSSYKPKEVYASTLSYPRNGTIVSSRSYHNNITDVYDCMELNKIQKKLIAQGVSEARKEGYDALINIRFDYVPIYSNNPVPKFCKVVITGDFVKVEN